MYNVIYSWDEVNTPDDLEVIDVKSMTYHNSRLAERTESLDIP